VYFAPITFSKPANIHFQLQMYTSAIRARMATSFAARRGFSTTRSQLGSPYHYAEGPRTNIPFNPLTKRFFWRYWAFMS
jgi:cytochrome c oxidase subunit 7c